MRFELAFDSPDDTDPKDRPPLVPSLAVFVVAHGKALCVYHIGTDAEEWIEQVDLDDFTKSAAGILTDDADGVYLWRGHIKVWRDYWGEHDEELACDEWRPVAAEEWAQVCAEEHVGDDAQLDAIEARAAWRERA